jgi:hypothetical protein
MLQGMTTEWLDDEEEAPKYIVWKQDGTPVDDAVVIRLKDPFAATALFTYSNTILSFVELMNTLSRLSIEEQKALVDIADYFHSKGVDSQVIKNKRLPD